MYFMETLITSGKLFLFSGKFIYMYLFPENLILLSGFFLIIISGNFLYILHFQQFLYNIT